MSLEVSGSMSRNAAFVRRALVAILEADLLVVAEEAWMGVLVDRGGEDSKTATVVGSPIVEGATLTREDAGFRKPHSTDIDIFPTRPLSEHGAPGLHLDLQQSHSRMRIANLDRLALRLRESRSEKVSQLVFVYSPLGA